MWLHSACFSHFSNLKLFAPFFYYIQHLAPFPSHKFESHPELFLFFISFCELVFKSCKKFNLNMIIFLPFYCHCNTSVHHYLLLSGLDYCNNILTISEKKHLRWSMPVSASWRHGLPGMIYSPRGFWSRVGLSNYSGHRPGWETVYEERIQVGVVHFSVRQQSWDLLSQGWEIKSVNSKWSWLWILGIRDQCATLLKAGKVLGEQWEVSNLWGKKSKKNWKDKIVTFLIFTMF